MSNEKGLLGIMADTHDNLPLIRRACELFNQKGVVKVIHAGDYIAPFSVLTLKENLKVDFFGVFGNNDGERLGLMRASEGRIHPSPSVLKVGEWECLVGHDLSEEVAEAIASSGRFRLVVFAHTHKALVKRVGESLLVNPGEVGGWLYGTSTVALVDLASLEGEIVKL